MSSDKYDKLRTKFEKNDADYLRFVDSATKEELEKDFDRYSKYLQEIALSMEKDVALNEAKEAVKELKAPYNDSKKVVNDKIKLIVYAIEQAWGFKSEE